MEVRVRRLIPAALVLVSLWLLAGCTTTLVQPYDDKLFTDTEALFKKASAMIDDGFASSPRTDDERNALKAMAGKTGKPLAEHPGHVSKFEPRYNELATDSDALILRALSSSFEVGPVGNRLQAKIDRLIEESIPSACPDQDAEFQGLTASLTVRNYIDLKCLLTRWKAQHNDSALTESTGILKRTNWELRKSTLFNAILVIQRAEAAKKK
jgi:hypothetical protein